LASLVAFELCKWHLCDRFQRMYSQMGVCRMQQEASWRVCRYSSEQRCLGVMIVLRQHPRPEDRAGQPTSAHLVSEPGDGNLEITAT
jgi:hypothetical protein